MSSSYVYPIDRAGGYDFISVNGELYSFCCLNNAICHIKNEKANMVFFDKNSKIRRESFSKLANIGNMILIPPRYDFNCYMYDVVTGETIRIDLGIDTLLYSERPNFWQVVNADNLFFVMGYSYPAIIMIDAVSKKVTILNKWVNEYIAKCGKSKENIDYYFSDGYVKEGDYIYFPTSIEATLFRLNVITSEYKFIKIKSRIKKILSVSKINGKIWLTEFDSSTSNYAIWDSVTENVIDGQLPSKGLWFNVVQIKGNAVFFPLKTSSFVYKVDCNDYSVEVFNELDDCLYIDNLSEKKWDVSTAKVYDKKLIIIRRDNVWITYDYETGSITSQIIPIAFNTCLDKIEKAYYEEIIDNGKRKQVFDEEDIPLARYMEII